jgi:uncharacterized protein
MTDMGMGFFFDPLYLLFIAPALLLALWAQMRVKSTYAEAQQIPAPLSGAAAARHILDSAGLNNVEIEQIPGQLTDHYDSQAKVLRLSAEVYQGRTLASVGIAAHESGHALQDARAYAPLVIRNIAVPAASFGSSIGVWMIFGGFLLSRFVPWWPLVAWAGVGMFACVVFFQIVNLPVEFNASSRAKVQLVELGIINRDELVYVNKVLDAAAWTYVAATLQSIMILLYYVVRLMGSERR